MRRVRYYKEAYTKTDFNEEQSFYTEYRLGITERQKRWQRRAWGFYIHYRKNSILPRHRQLSIEDLIANFDPAINKPVCMFPRITQEGQFVINGTRDYLHLHHIVPKAFMLQRQQQFDPDNVATNIIPINRLNHVGYRYSGWLPSNFEDLTDTLMRELPIIHPDTELARRLYAVKGREAYEEMREFRNRRLEWGEPYHNTSYDRLFTQTAEETVSLYTTCFSEVYPQRP